MTIVIIHEKVFRTYCIPTLLVASYSCHVFQEAHGQIFLMRERQKQLGKR